VSDILPFQPRLAETKEAKDGGDGPHLEGEAICGACHHEWRAVSPTGTVSLECPKCNRMWGTFKHQVEPETAWHCKCGEWLFWLTPTGAMCRRCGIRSNDWAD
jgi:hypothetical protein